MLGITGGADGWHTFYLRRRRAATPLPRLADALGSLLVYALARLIALSGKPWRRLGAALRSRA
ncbi:MAG TPA: hypothetical protein VKB51_03655 [bacterium]|nr:hypothetical protein [bacterium]